MFTGIIQDIGTIRAIEKKGDWRLEIQTALDLAARPIGASIACGGCCLTVIEKGPDWFAAEVSQESLSITTIGDWQVGTKINLEPSLRMGDELGGHFVFGHVDAIALIQSITSEGESFRFEIEVPAAYQHLIAAKGSVTLDGISLTVNAVKSNVFTVNIIPHTWMHTTMGLKKPFDHLNFEVDMLARYMARMLEAQNAMREAA